MENLRFGLMFDCLRGNEGGKGIVTCNGQNCLYGYCIIFEEPLRKEYDAVHSLVRVLPSFP